MLVRLALIISFLATFISCGSSVEIQVDLSSGPTLGAKDIYGGISRDYINHPAGHSRRKVDYVWQLYVGYDTSQAQIHFSDLRLTESDLLAILNAQGEELQRFVGSNSGEQWSQAFRSNLLRIHLVSDLPENGKDSYFRIDRVRIWSLSSTPPTIPPTNKKLSSRHPTFGVRSLGAFPNVHPLQYVQPVPRTQVNQEAWGIIGPNGDNYYSVLGVPWLSSDFAVVGPSCGAPSTINVDRDVWYRSQEGPIPDTVVVGNFGGDSHDDVAVANDQGEVLISLNQGEAKFTGFHLAQRHFNLFTGELLVAGRMNDDTWDDLLAVSPSAVRFALNNGNADYPQFCDVVTAMLPWDVVGFPQDTRFTPLTGDFDGDGFIDIAIVVDRNGEDVNVEQSWDEVRIFKNDHAGGFTEFTPWARYKLANGTSADIRSFQVGDFNGDGFDDFLLVDRPSYAAIERRFSLRVSLNKLSTSGVLSTGYETWVSFILESRESGGSKIQKFVDEVIVADINGDRKADVVLCNGDQTFDPGSRFGSVKRTELLVSFSEKSPLTYLPIFGPAANWSPSTMPLGKLHAGNFTSDQYAQTLISTQNKSSLLHVFVMTNKLFPVIENIYSSNAPQPGFGDPVDRLLHVPHYAFGDVDSDGYSDLIVFTGDQRGTVEVLLNKQSTTGESHARQFERSDHSWLTEFANDFAPGHECPLAGDVNGDGYADLVLFSGIRPSFVPDENVFPFGVFVALNNRDGSFSKPTRWNTMLALNLADPKRTPLIGDFNGDGKVDIAIAARFPSVYFYIALSTGNAFGSTSWGYDWLAPTDLQPASWDSVDYKITDMNGDGIQDIALIDTWCTYFLPTNDGRYYATFAGNITSFQSDGGGSFTRHHEMAIGGYGIPQGNRFELGQFSGDRFADIAHYLSSQGRRAFDGNSICSWFSIQGIDWTATPVARYTNGGPTDEDCPSTFSVDVDKDGRDELVLLRQDLGCGGGNKIALELQMVKMAHSDLDLYAQPAFDVQQNGVPLDGWTSSSITPFDSEELISDQYSPTGNFFLRVHNNSEDWTAYKMICNLVTNKISMDAVFVKKEVYTNSDYYRDFINLIKEAGPRLYDATDGLHKLTEITLWTANDPSYWEDDHCSDRVDIQVFDGAGTSNARHGCRIR